MCWSGAFVVGWVGWRLPPGAASEQNTGPTAAVLFRGAFVVQTRGWLVRTASRCAPGCRGTTFSFMRTWVRNSWFPMLMATLAATTASAGLIGRTATGFGFWVVNGLAIGSIAAAAVVPIVRNSRRESATARADELAVQVRAAADRKTLTERVLTLGVTVAAGLVDAVRARSTLYHLDPASTGWRLVPTNNAGRSDQARTVFEEGTDAGDAVRAMVDGDEIVYCRDIRQEQPLGWVADPSRSYRTFISVPVTAGDEAFGMLTVNALEPDDLGDEDVSTMRVISAVLGAALALGGPRRKHVGGR